MDYLKQNDDGTTDITLGKVIDIDGAKVSALRMREPTVNDQLIMDARKGSYAVKEMTFIADLCGVTMDDIKKLTLRDYKRVQNGLGAFLD